ncbi:MAG: hypothetical protein BWK72_16000 [Rhodoferax ferrireducens]|uniref:Diguanylate cyclase/phosphodiesterase with PAS/PAC sensor(S) n=1 Tax=Rhodoferax ferrireducens TaxID=192843 RepID=A0A1W9KRE5_9BURK|nr:MAG: hypothetical protein BWK72_16000 [Rhodoferax ferrireducens]
MNHSRMDFFPDHFQETDYGIADLVDIEQLRNLFERFTKATGFTIGFLDHPRMNVLIATGWKRICTDFHRRSPAAERSCFSSNQQLLKDLGKTDQAVVQICKHGLADCAIPIIVEGRHLASLATGQMLLNKPDLDQFTRQAEEFGFDTTDYLQALAEVNIVDEERLKAITNYLGAMAQMISQMGYAKLKLKNEMVRRKHSDAVIRIAAIAFESQEGMVITDASGIIMRVNKSFTDITGYAAEEAVGQNPRILTSGRHDRDFYEVMYLALKEDGVWAGEIWNKHKDGHIYPEWLTISAVTDDAKLLSHYVAIFTDISERFNAQAQIDTMTFLDPLTHLSNRRLLLDRLEQTLRVSARHSRKSALLFVDLDNFKVLNETLGHHQGDFLLKQVAERLKTCIPEGDTLAHLGSDEFAVMLEDLSEFDLEAATMAEAVATKILTALQQDFLLNQVPYHSSASIGIALFGGDTLNNSDQPLRHAELAMFQAKVNGRNMLRFFDTKMQTEVSAKAALESDLRVAVQKQQFVLHYQPQVQGVGHMTGAEVLVRWQHPERGMVSPADFIPLAEESGLILPIGQWVLESACTRLAAWADDPDLSHMTISVNVSARQFKHLDFVDSVLATLERTRAQPKNLKLELTESMLVDDVEAVIVKMGLLKACGVTFSLDDFGTGYSSLAYLKRLPLDQLKIDQAFVQNIVTDPNDGVIAKMVVVLAESMGLSVIAEGVELQTQVEFLASLGCHAYQGYLFSKPLPQDAFEAFAKSTPVDQQSVSLLH